MKLRLRVSVTSLLSPTPRTPWSSDLTEANRQAGRKAGWACSWGFSVRAGGCVCDSLLPPTPQRSAGFPRGSPGLLARCRKPGDRSDPQCGRAPAPGPGGRRGRGCFEDCSSRVPGTGAGLCSAGACPHSWGTRASATSRLESPWCALGGRPVFPRLTCGVLGPSDQRD